MRLEFSVGLRGQSGRGVGIRALTAEYEFLECFVGVFSMKWLTSLFCALFLAGMIVVVPSGCSGSNKATQIDASQFDDAANDADEMEDESEDDGDGASDAGEMSQ